MLKNLPSDYNAKSLFSIAMSLFILSLNLHRFWILMDWYMGARDWYPQRSWHELMDLDEHRQINSCLPGSSFLQAWHELMLDVQTHNLACTSELACVFKRRRSWSIDALLESWKVLLTICFSSRRRFGKFSSLIQISVHLFLSDYFP
jgi:hypothetical protein